MEPSQNSIKLTWIKPNEDGGATISSYIAQVKRNSNPTNWSTCKTTNELSCVISGVDVDTGYTVEVQAINQVGKGNFDKGILVKSLMSRGMSRKSCTLQNNSYSCMHYRYYVHPMDINLP